MNNDYISRVLSQINNKTARPLIEQELEAHLQDRVDYFTELGYSTEEAECKAVEAMGEPDNTAIPLDSLHNDRWYKRPELYFAMGFLVVQFVIAMFFAKSFKYADEQIVHYITFDFISLVFVIISFLFMRLAGKKRNKIALLIFAVSAIAGVFSTYQPSFYGIVKLIESGFSGYINSIFTYGCVAKESDMLLTFTLKCVTWFFVAIMLIYNGSLYVKIRNQELGRMKPQKFDLSKMLEKVVAGILSINMIFMLCCTAFAYRDIDSTIACNEKLRKSIIDSILNIDLISKDSADCIEYLKINISNFEKKPNEINLFYEAFNQNTCVDFYDWKYSSDKNMLSSQIEYRIINDRNSLINRNLYIDGDYLEENFCDCFHGLDVGWSANEFVDEAMYSFGHSFMRLFQRDFDDERVNCNDRYFNDNVTMAKSPCTMDEFIKGGWYTRAVRIGKYAVKGEQSQQQTEFKFLLKNSKYKMAKMIFENDRLTEVNLYYNK